MGREVRLVPPDWKHPVDSCGRPIGLFKESYSESIREYNENIEKWKEGLVRSYDERVWEPMTAEEAAISFNDYYGDKPEEEEHMPDFEEGTATHFMMYENTSEGTPISPAFATPEELARWLVDNKASAFGSMTATYEQWLNMAKVGIAPSMIIENGVASSGVAFINKDNQNDT